MQIKFIHTNILQLQTSDSLPAIGELVNIDVSGVCNDMPLSPLWLIDQHWNALAECSSVKSANNSIDIRCDYYYTELEVKVISQTLVRLFAGEVDPYIYLLAAKQDYIDAMHKGYFTRDSLDDEGFIHATPYSQLTRLANKYYKSVKDPHLLKVDKKLIKPEVKWEPAKGGLYPHIYGVLNSDAIVAIEPILLGECGEFNIC